VKTATFVKIHVRLMPSKESRGIMVFQEMK